VKGIGHAVAMSADRARKRSVGNFGSSASLRRPERPVRLSQLRRLRECEQVAAVCYRVGSKGVEFLLVRTRGSGRWTFPKGSTEAGLTHAQAAALEAFEEAGVHGRIEEASFARYVRRKGDGRKSRRAGERETAVNAHLCEVSRLSPPQESNRDRTWFSAQDARQRLREGREAREGASFARVVDRAVARISQLRSRTEVIDVRQRDVVPGGVAVRQDALQEVRFEAFEGAYREMAEAWFGTNGRPRGVVAAKSRQTLQGEVLEFVPSREKKTKALGTGTRNR